MNNQTDQQFDCCPPFDPGPWDNQVKNWENKTFIRERVATFLYMPLNFGGVMRRLDKKVRAAGATVPDYLCLSDHTSKWNMDLYLAVDKNIPGAHNTTLSGQYLSKVYEGPFKDTGKWMKDFDTMAQSKGVHVQKTYMWYTTCPKCAKKYGRNYVVVMGQI